MKTYCVTHKKISHLNKVNLIPFGVGSKKYPKDYLKDNSYINIAYKNKNFGDLTFHYWYWKNLLNSKSKEWIGICQYRRFFVEKKFKKNISNSKISKEIIKKHKLENIILKKVPKEWKKYQAILCDPWDLKEIKLSKLLKRGLRNILKDPLILFIKKKRNINLHFDMWHGYGNLNKAIDLLSTKYREDFRKYCNIQNHTEANNMFYSKPKIMNELYKDLFDWLFKCEKIFNKKELIGYDLQRIYCFLSERFIPFWFKKNVKFTHWPWIFYEE